jgi:pyruvate kinase
MSRALPPDRIERLPHALTKGLDVADEHKLPRDRTKVVATLGPASTDPTVLGRMIEVGLDVIRLNFSHGTREEHLERIKMVREVAAKHGEGRIAILADLQGPKIRVGIVPDEGVVLEAGQTVELVSGVETAPPPAIPVVYEHLAEDVGPGDRILIDDGAIELRVEAVEGDLVRCRVVQAGVVKSRKGVNLPGVAVSAESLTDKDKADLVLACEGGVDYIALSFVRRARDVRRCKRLIADAGGDVPVVAKLERPEAIDNLDEIIQASDGVMVARGDLGVEVAVEKVPTIQKRIIARANSLGVPVITATQMLESMITNPRPTRAEASDVANAVFDGTDAVMLSGETAVGKWPVEAVRAMSHIVREAESASELLHPPPPPSGRLNVPATVCRSAVAAAEELDAQAIVAFTETGSTARFVSRFRPKVRIVGISPNETSRRRMALYWGVEAAPCLDFRHHLHEMVAEGDERLIEGGWANPDDIVIVVAGTPGGIGGTNRVIVHKVGEPEGSRDAV